MAKQELTPLQKALIDPKWLERLGAARGRRIDLKGAGIKKQVR